MALHTRTTGSVGQLRIAALRKGPTFDRFLSFFPDLKLIEGRNYELEAPLVLRIGKSDETVEFQWRYVLSSSLRK